MKLSLGTFLFAASLLACSSSETVWAIPTNCADTQYVTVVNQAFAEGDAVLPSGERAGR